MVSFQSKLLTVNIQVKPIAGPGGRESFFLYGHNPFRSQLASGRRMSQVVLYHLSVFEKV